MKTKMKKSAIFQVFMTPQRKREKEKKRKREKEKKRRTFNTYMRGDIMQRKGIAPAPGSIKSGLTS